MLDDWSVPAGLAILLRRSKAPAALAEGEMEVAPWS